MNWLAAGFQRGFLAPNTLVYTIGDSHSPSRDLRRDELAPAAGRLSPGNEKSQLSHQKCAILKRLHMSSATPIPITEYLKSDYSPDCDYVDGELLERNVGEWEHAALQGILTAIFANHRKAWGVIALPEQRVQVSGSNYRVADLSVVEIGAPRQPIVRTLPLLAIEILSRSDSLQAIRKRGNDYLKMGVQNF
jgi:hypothetical protein